MSFYEMENENANLKERIKELETALMPPPIFASPIHHYEAMEDF
jgi:hypothetical protein